MIPTFDPDGEFVGHAPSEAYVAKALRRGELVRSDEGHLVVVPQPLRELTPDEKRRNVLAKERKNR